MRKDYEQVAEYFRADMKCIDRSAIDLYGTVGKSEEGGILRLMIDVKPEWCVGAS